jgi:uncharacterized protein (TIGR03437 family)
MNRILIGLLAGAAAFGQEPKLTITWVGQACFILKSDTATVVTDPPVASVGYAIPSVAANAVTISHNHTDHNNAAGVGGQFTLIDGRPVTARQQVTAAGIPFIQIPGFHDNANGTARGQNTIVTWTQSGLKMAHFGDLGQEQLTAAQLADLRDLDVLFIPAGGFFTFSPERAAQYVAELRPRVAIPMHYKTAIGGPAQLAGLPAVGDVFSQALPVVYQPSMITLGRSSLPATTEVWVMEPRSDTVAVNAAGFRAGKPVAPGSLVSLFGRFTGSQTGQAQSYPLPRKIGDTEVFVDGKATPLFYTSPGQINFQLPAATAAGQYVVEVRVGGQAVTRTSATVIANAPGLFLAANTDGSVNSAANPARRSDSLVLFGTGQGAVTPAVEDGVAAGATLSRSNATPLVFIAGKQMPVQFSGLAPGYAGLWQINVPLAEAPTGSDLELTVVNGGTSNRLAVSVRQ